MKINRHNILGIIRLAPSKRLFISILTIIAMFVIVYCCQKVFFYLPDYGIEKTTINIEKTNHPLAPYDFMWFSYDDEKVKLNINMMVDDISKLKLYSLAHGGAEGEAPGGKVIPLEYSNPNSPIPLNAALSGNHVAVLPPFQADVNNDGKKETINVSAKIGAVFTHTGDFLDFLGMNEESVLFADERIPMEVLYMEDGKMMVFYGPGPLANTEVQLISNRGLNKKVRTDAAGNLPRQNYKDVRSGIQVVYVGEDNTYNIASYTVENETLLTGYHLKAMLPFIYSIALSSVLIFLIWAIMRVYSQLVRKKYKTIKVVRQNN